MSTSERVMNVGAAVRASDTQKIADVAATADDRALEALLPPGSNLKAVLPLSTAAAALLVVGQDTDATVLNGKVRLRASHLIAGKDAYTIGLAAHMDGNLDSAVFGNNSSGLTRYDLLYATVQYSLTLSQTVRQKAPQGFAPVSAVLPIQNDITVTLGIVSGVSSSTPLASLPADSGSGMTAVYNFGLAMVTIANGFSGGAINQASIAPLWTPAMISPWLTRNPRDSFWRELLMALGTFTSSQNPIPNFGQLQIAVSGAGSSVAFNEPGAISSSYNGRSATLVAGNSNGQYGSLFSGSKFAGFANPANLYLCAEWEAALDASAMSNSPFCAFGFHDSNSFPTAVSNGIYVTYQNPLNGSHFALHVASTRGGGNSNVVLAAEVDPAAGVFQHFKLEFYGASTPQGLANGSAFVRLTINGVEATTLSLAANKIPATNCYFGGGVESISTNAATGYLGNWTMQWDRY